MKEEERTESEVARNKERFKGYIPPLISLGGNTDPGYWHKFYTHPYYVNQPAYWKQPTYQYGAVTVYGKADAVNQENTSEGSTLYSLMPLTI